MKNKKSVKKKKTIKKVSRKRKITPKKNVKKRLKFHRFKDTFKKKKLRLFDNLLKFVILFIIFLVLYFVTGSPFLKDLFALVAIICGAIVVALFLIWVSFLLYKKLKK